MSDPGENPRFLISRLSAFGDVVCTLPAAGALKRAFPTCEIVWLADPRFKALPERCRFVDQVIACKPGLSPSTWPRIEGSFDAAFDLQGLLKSGLLLWKAKAPKRLGFHWQREFSWLISERVLPDPTSLHVVDQIVDVARAAGGEADGAEFGLEPTPHDLQRASELLAPLEGRPFAVLNPGGAWASKRWPAGRFGELADGLDEAGCASVLIGAPSEAELEGGRLVAKACRRAKPLDLVGKTSFGDLVGVLNGCVLHVGGDTGSSHLAAALGRAAIGLYSATRPERTCPYGQIERCLYDPSALSNIDSQAVLAKCLEALN
ncbi:MAG: glycosyltransferase family 9 protein [Armatimonadetes bacterium]|nr:glycosyltransferase family 9 protein [Armatimonadota bacterium]